MTPITPRTLRRIKVSRFASFQGVILKIKYDNKNNIKDVQRLKREYQYVESSVNPIAATMKTINHFFTSLLGISGNIDLRNFG